MRFDQAHANKVSEDIVLAFIAKNVKENKHVNGIRFKVRKGVLTIEVWVSDISNGDLLEDIRDWIVDAMCLNPDTPIELIKFQVE